MMKAGLIGALFFVAFGVSEVEASGCVERWSIFASRPNFSTFQSLKNALNVCRTEKSTVPAYTANLFEALIRADNKYAVSIAFAASDLFDGGDLEDIDLAVATIAISDPRTLLQMFKIYRTSEFRIRSILATVPDSAVDDLAAQVQLMDQRAAHIRNVKDSALRDERTKTLSALADIQKKLLAASTSR